MAICARKWTNDPPGIDQGFLQAAMATMHCQPEWCIHAPPLVPPFLRTYLQNELRQLITRGQNLTTPKDVNGG